MGMQKQNGLLGKRSERPIVVVDSWVGASTMLHNLFRLCWEREWQLLNLRFSGNILPAGVKPIGAFVSRLPDDPYVKQLMDAGCPVVRLGQAPHPKDNIVPAVLRDMVAVGRMAADHFFDKGFRHVGYIGQKPWGFNKPFYTGMYERAEELQCGCHLLQWATHAYSSQEDNYRERMKLFAEWVESVPKPLGLLAFSDERCAFYARMSADFGYSIPEQIGLLGVGNDIDICETVLPSLSSVEYYTDEICAVGVDLLERLLAGRPIPNNPILIPPRGVVTRQSTDVMEVSDGAVAAALRFIWNNYDKDISVGQVASAAGLSTRTLSNRFRKHLGKGVIAVLRDRRLERAKELLRITDMPISDVASRVGFISVETFHRSFRDAFDMTPGCFRNHG